MNKNLYFLISLAVLTMVGPAFSKTKVTPTATPVPKQSPNLAAMQKALRFWVYEKSSDVVNDVTGLFDNKSQKITLKCELKNQTAKEIHGVRGTLRFTTYFGDVIADVYIETQLPIPPGQVLGVNWDVPTNRLTPEAFEKLKKAKMEQMKQVWYPRMIVFTDGTALK
jgi:hypothetical protein